MRRGRESSAQRRSRSPRPIPPVSARTLDHSDALRSHQCARPCAALSCVSACSSIALQAALSRSSAVAALCTGREADTAHPDWRHTAHFAGSLSIVARRAHSIRPPLSRSSPSCPLILHRLAQWPRPLSSPGCKRRTQETSCFGVKIHRSRMDKLSWSDSTTTTESRRSSRVEARMQSDQRGRRDRVRSPLLSWSCRAQITGAGSGIGLHVSLRTPLLRALCVQNRD